MDGWLSRVGSNSPPAQRRSNALIASQDDKDSKIGRLAVPARSRRGRVGRRPGLRVTRIDDRFEAFRRLEVERLDRECLARPEPRGRPHRASARAPRVVGPSNRNPARARSRPGLNLLSRSPRPRPRVGEPSSAATRSASPLAQVLPLSQRSFCSSKRAGLRARARSRTARRSGVERPGRRRAPTEQRQLVANRGGQVAGIAQLLHGGGAVAL